jgi:hypothetical protein
MSDRRETAMKANEQVKDLWNTIRHKRLPVCEAQPHPALALISTGQSPVSLSASLL